jgi:DNA-binding transcriptional ArsR family regulator
MAKQRAGRHQAARGASGAGSFTHATGIGSLHARPRAGRAAPLSHPAASSRATPLARLTGKRALAYSRRVGDVFKALADPTRRTILDELADRSPQTLFELCARLAAKHQLGMSRQAVSQHLDVLERAGLVESRKEGRYKFHHLQPAPLATLTDRWLRGDPPESS